MAQELKFDFTRGDKRLSGYVAVAWDLGPRPELRSDVPQLITVLSSILQGSQEINRLLARIRLAGPLECEILLPKETLPTVQLALLIAWDAVFGVEPKVVQLVKLMASVDGKPDIVEQTTDWHFGGVLGMMRAIYKQGFEAGRGSSRPT